MKKILLSLPNQYPTVIFTNVKSLPSFLRLKFGKYVTDKEIPSLEEIHIWEDNGVCTFTAKEDSHTTENPLTELDRYLFEHPTYDASVLALHGAAVEWQGGANLFLAATTSGKTTLTSYLTSFGCGYLTDDCILLDRSTFLVHPCTTPIQLRDGGLEVLKAYQAAPKNLQLLEEAHALRRWVYTPKNSIEAKIPLKRIFFIERTENENGLIDMSTTERITALMKSPITNYSVTGDYLRLLARLAKIDCHILRYCDMRYVKELIQNG